jgi:hypothetical protein
MLRVSRLETLTEEQGNRPVSGFTVYDMVLVMHLIEKLLRNGLVTGKELSYVAGMRAKAVFSAQMASGFNIENLASPSKPPTTEETEQPQETQGG